MTDWIEEFRSPTVGLPAVALLMKEGKVWWSGAEQDVADLADVLGSGVGSLGASGLDVFAANSNRPAAAGALLSAMAASGGFTILMQLLTGSEIENIPGDHILLQAVKGSYQAEMNLQFAGNELGLFDYNMASIRRDAASPLTGSVNKICATVKSNAYALAANGSAAVQNADGLQDAWDTIRIGFYDGDASEAECSFERLIVWAPLPVSEVEARAA